MTALPLPDNPLSLQALRALLVQRNVLAALEVFHAGLGDAFTIPLPGFNPVMLVGAEANRFVLVEEREDLRWRSEQDPVTRLLRHGVLVEDGESHDTLRRQMTPALHRRMLESYVETMWQSTDTILNQWQTGAPLEMLVESRKIALLILMKTLFSVDFHPDLNRLWKSILRTLRYIAPGAWVVWRDVPRSGYQRALMDMDRYLFALIAERRRSGGHEGDLLGLLIGAGLTDDLIRDQLLTMIIAGHDTSTALLSWAFYLLSSHQGIQAAVRQEIDTSLGANPPDLERVGTMPLLEQVINETLRLYPPIHLGSRIAARDLEFQGYHIPAGRRVVYSIYLTHRDARYWENPAAFDPSRFSPEQARRQPPYTFLPFGGGARNCIGMAFAQVEAKVVLALVLQRFELQFTGNAVRVQMGATLEPRPGVRVAVRARR